MADETSKSGGAGSGAQASSGAGLSSSNSATIPLVVGVVALVAGLAIGYAIWGLSPAHANYATTTVPLTSSNSSASLQSTLPTTTSLEGGGAGQYYISRAEADAIAGGPGKYSATYVPGNMFAAQAPAGYNISGVYQMYYNTSTNISANVLSEDVYLTNNPAYDYAHILNSSSATLFNRTYLAKNGGTDISIVTNATMAGMRYSMVGFTYSQPTVLGANAIVHGIYLIGTKGDSVATISAGAINSTLVISSNALIGTVAGDLPNSSG